ncbi:host specificity factor TipJ family phage tail protein [Achromobacter xylosoxidans]
MEGVNKQRVGPVAAPSMVVYPKPLGGERTEHFECFAPGETLGAYVRRVGITIPSRVLRVEHNGREVPLSLWERLIPRHGDMVVISARGLGGGGGGKILRTVALIAIVVLSYGYGAALGGALGLTGTTAAAVGSSLIMIGGSLLVNALLPPLMPTAAKLGAGEKYESSPTYAISGGRNRSRPWEPMLLVFGRHKVVPDLGATPYGHYNGDAQYFDQCFHFGLQGISVDISDVRIGQTPISAFQDIQMQRSDESGHLGLISGNVDAIQGFTLSNSDEWQARTTPSRTTFIVVDLAARLFTINDDGEFSPRSVLVRVQYRAVGASTWVDVETINAVYATHYWSGRALPGESQQIRMGSTNSADHTDGDRFFVTDQDGAARAAVWRWLPHPYQSGQPWAGIAPDPLLSPGQPGIRITGARQDVTRRQVSWVVPEGQYEVRVYKETTDVNTSRESNETAVAQILAYQVDDADYNGQARLALRIKATGQLNGAIDELSAIISAGCPVWNGDAWEWKETSNPAWWFLWFARGKALNGIRVYGAALSDSQIDIEGIKAWAAWCDKKKLTFDYVLDQKMSAAGVLQMIARAGRGALTYQTGKLGVIWDAEAHPVTAMFGPFNVKAGSFKIAYTNDGTVDEVVLNFVNKDNGWIMDEVRVRVPGASTTNNPLQLDLDGCTNKDMAGREANLIAAAQVWKRRKITWETDIEGLVCTRGDVVSFSHDLTVWGYSGRLMPGSGNTLMRLQNKVPSSGTGTAMLRDPDGNMKVVTVSSAVGDVDELTIVSDLDGFPMPGDEGYEDCSPFDWAWQFDPIATPGRRFKVSGVTPAGDGLRFEAVDDDPEYYASEADPYQYTPPRDGALLSGVVFSVTGAEQILNVQSDLIRLTVSWIVTSDVPCLVVVTVNGVVRSQQVLDGRTLDVMVRTGDVVDVSVTPKRLTGSGEPKRASFKILGLSAPLPTLTGLQSVFRDGLTWLAWDRVQDVRQPVYEVRRGTTWQNADVVAVTASIEQLAVGNGLYWVAARFQLSNGAILYGIPDSLLISGATLERNVIIVRQEAPTWPGSLGGGAMVSGGLLTLAPTGDVLALVDVLAQPDVLWYGGPAASGSYTIRDVDRVDIGYVAPVRIDLEVAFLVRNLTEDILGASDVFGLVDVLNGTDRQYVRVAPQIRFAQVDGEWSEWRDYVPGLLNARFFDVRLLLESSDPNIVPFVEAFSWTIDVPDLVQRDESLDVPSAGMAVTYQKKFHAVPNVQITLLDAQASDQIVLTDSNEEGFFVQVKSGATNVARSINWIAQGY